MPENTQGNAAKQEKRIFSLSYLKKCIKEEKVNLNGKRITFYKLPEENAKTYIAGGYLANYFYRTAPSIPMIAIIFTKGCVNSLRLSIICILLGTILSSLTINLFSIPEKITPRKTPRSKDSWILLTEDSKPYEPEKLGPGPRGIDSLRIRLIIAMYALFNLTIETGFYVAVSKIFIHLAR